MKLTISEHLGDIANLSIIDNKYFYIYLPFNIFVSNLNDILLFQLTYFKFYKINRNLNY